MDTDAPKRPSTAAFVPDGAVARSWFFLGQAWTSLRGDRALLAIAAAGLLLNMVATALVFGAGAWLADRWGAYDAPAVMAAASVPGTFLSTYFNVALLWLANERLEGRPRTVREGFAAANRRLRSIVAWSLLAAGVGALLNWLAEKLPLGGALATWLLGVIWSLATLFALPVLVLEDAGARRAAQRSAEIFRARWGEGLGGSIAVTGLAMFAALPGIVLFLVGLFTGGPLGIALAVAGGLLLGAAMTFTGALQELFALALYRHQVLGATSFGLEPSQLDAFVDVKQRRGGR